MTITPFRRTLTGGWLLALCLGSLSALAHDPGLSGSEFDLGAQAITATVSFSWKDIDGIVPLDTNLDGALGAEEMEELGAELRGLGARLFSLQSGGETLPVASVSVAHEAIAQDVVFTLRYDASALAAGGPVTIALGAFDHLPSGHAHLLRVRAAEGGWILQDLLTRRHASTTVSPPIGMEAAPEAATPRSFGAFVFLGAEHILFGYDHLLFLLAILLVCRRGRTLLIAITCFTVAHSITLGLAALDLFRLPAAVVEPIIAASIVAVVLFDFFTKQRTTWLPAMTFGFGLVHGLGFAGSVAPIMEAVSKSGAGIVSALAGFNIGVELGQLLIIAVIYPLLRLAAARGAWFERWLQPAGCAAVALIGTYWTVQRILW